MRCGRFAACAAHRNLVFTDLRQLHLREVAHHVGQEVVGGVADLVDQLLGHGGDADQATGLRGLFNHEATVWDALQDGVADVSPIRHVLPVGVQATGGLAAALDQMAGEATLG